MYGSLSWEEKIIEIEITNDLTKELDAKHPQTHKQGFSQGQTPRL